MKLIDEMTDALLKRYDAITKMDAAIYLKELFPKMTLKQFRKAYDNAYV